MLRKNAPVEDGNISEKDVTHHAFVKAGHRHYIPQCLSAGATAIKYIFPIPEPNTIGTLDSESNSIVFVTFGDYGKKPKHKVIAQDEYGSFNYQLSSNFSEDSIVYCKNKIVVVANVKLGETFLARCGLSKKDCLRGIRFLDPQNSLFVIVKSIYDGNSKMDNYLHIVKLEGKRFIDTGWTLKIGETRDLSSDFSPHNIWHVHDKMLFVYDKGLHKIECTNGGTEVPHPFATTFNDNASRIGRIHDFSIHPTLPFGVVVEDVADGKLRNRLMIINTNFTDPKKQDEIAAYSIFPFQPFAEKFGLKSMTLAYHSFSPCGKWYVAGCIDLSSSTNKDPYFIAIPINPEYYDFLDFKNLVVLGQVKNMTSMAWTHEPTSLVVSNGELLHKWDLEELPNARVFVVPGEGEGGADDGRKKRGILGRLFGGKKK